jgi:hypothetical protein
MALRWLCIVILCTVTVVVSLKIVPLSNDVRNEYTSLDYVPSGAQFLYRPDSPQLNLNNRERRATSQNVISTNFAFTNDQNPYALIYFSGDKSSVIFVLTFTPRYNSSICNFYSISSRLWRWVSRHTFAYSLLSYLCSVPLHISPVLYGFIIHREIFAALEFHKLATLE